MSDFINPADNPKFPHTSAALVNTHELETHKFVFQAFVTVVSLAHSKATVTKLMTEMWADEEMVGGSLATSWQTVFFDRKDMQTKRAFNEYVGKVGKLVQQLQSALKQNDEEGIDYWMNKYEKFLCAWSRTIKGEVYGNIEGAP